MKIICIGRNYVAHVLELKNEIPSSPVIFLKPKTALVHQSYPVHYPEFTDDLQYEAEVVLRICKNGKNIAERHARNYYDKWTIGIDFTARDLQTKLKKQGLPWEMAKAFDGSCVVGDFVDIPKDTKNVPFELYQNEEKVQSGNTDNMIFSFDKIVSFVSKYFTLQMGDLVFTGTPEGVGPVLPYDELVGKLNGAELLKVTII